MRFGTVDVAGSLATRTAARHDPQPTARVIAVLLAVAGLLLVSCSVSTPRHGFTALGRVQGPGGPGVQEAGQAGGADLTGSSGAVAAGAAAAGPSSGAGASG